MGPVQSGDRGIREVSFYEGVTASTAQWLGMRIAGERHRTFARLGPFLCDYHGVVALKPQNVDLHCYILLDDCTHDMQRPCALDIKLGTRTTEPGACMEKQRKSLAK